MLFYLLAGLSLRMMIFSQAERVGERGLVTDYLTSLLIILSFLVGGLMLRGRWGIKIWQKNRKIYIFVSLAIVLILVLTFKVRNLLYFYIFFEAGLIPIFLMILG